MSAHTGEAIIAALVAAIDKYRCDTCGQSLAEDHSHCGVAGDHMRRRTLAEARRVAADLHIDESAALAAAISQERRAAVRALGPVPRDADERADYLRRLLPAAGLSQMAAARILAVDGRTVTGWIQRPPRQVAQWVAVDWLRCWALGEPPGGWRPIAG
jgi:hypothetical protein